jgi:hypothetical protein
MEFGHSFGTAKKQARESARPDLISFSKTSVLQPPRPISFWRSTRAQNTPDLGRAKRQKGGSKVHTGLDSWTAGVNRRHVRSLAPSENPLMPATPLVAERDSR